MIEQIILSLCSKFMLFLKAAHLSKLSKRLKEMFQIDYQTCF